ncbi:MAG: helix-turn-helix transcriptional regulator [Rhizobiaceae bacterium]|nr:helix-turn-helix transcriptional regulator [Rhizobiaceae bacterium]MCV0405317.1 helix-turn-helix transcriptional regulator [Rhizobiaceae bacterium]
MRCSLGRALDVIGDWWSPLIIRDLFLGIGRFDELVEDLGISRNLLTRRLNLLAEAGVIERQAYQLRPRRWEYRLTAKGRDLVPALLALTEWGNRWAAPEEGPPMLFVHTGCGGPVTPTVVCSECGRPLQADEIRAVAGPGGAAGPGTRVLARRLTLPH